MRDEGWGNGVGRRSSASSLIPHPPPNGHAQLVGKEAHVVVGHSGTDEAQLLVALDDAYDEVQYLVETIEDLDRSVYQEARRLAS